MDNQQLARAVGMLMGEVWAYRYAISTLISTHPDPDVLLHVWQQSKPAWIEETDQATFFKLPEFQTGFLQSLSGLTQTVERAAERD